MMGAPLRRLHRASGRREEGVVAVNVSLVLTVIGPDRPGIVQRLAQTIAEHDANWLQSRMAHLAGQFAGILRVGVPEHKATALSASLEQLAADGLRVVIERTVTADAVSKPQSLRLELVGNDRPGIVRDISRVLADRGVNVEDLTTECDAAPMSGGTLFRATAELHAPHDLSLEELHRTLEELANDLMVEITLDEAL
jgi:glycine cleavage system regulatory protein